MKRSIAILLAFAILLCSCNTSIPEESQEITVLPELALLLENDRRFTDLVILGGIFENMEAETYTPQLLSKDNEYYLYSSIYDFAFSVYVAEEAEKMLSLPEYGPKYISEKNGITTVTKSYIPAYDSEYIKAEQIVLSSYKATVAVTKKDGRRYLIHFSNTSQGWRMERSLFSISRTSAVNAHKSTIMGNGSGSVLKGKCLIISVFIEDEISSWERDGIIDITAKLDQAGRFIKQCAEYYGTECDITFSDMEKALKLKADGIIPNKPEGFSWTEDAFSATEYKTIDEYIGKSFDISLYDSYCCIFHINKKGRSYALVCDKAYDDWRKFQTEKAVVFHTEDKKYPYFDSIGVYVHEILHIFGAKDLYSLTEKNELLMENCFPNDIMRTIPSDIELAFASPFTAFCVGWTEGLEEQFSPLNE